MTQRCTLKKQERLCSRTLIQTLFDQGQSFVKYPFRVTYLSLESDADKAVLQMLVSVSKRRFKRAVKRNRLKRLSREAYRLNKHALADQVEASGKGLAVAFIYLPSEMLDYKAVEKGMKKALKKLQQETADHEK
ncbi:MULTISPECIES: ribonuclease P protein component [unclassified Carboxylicivirga]|uniref:ribonuclease P protein component n=1 Tax=Carboxylicivirga TaxID=1628153 RepID=UPI003D337C16